MYQETAIDPRQQASIALASHKEETQQQTSITGRHPPAAKSSHRYQVATQTQYITKIATLHRRLALEPEEQPLVPQTNTTRKQKRGVGQHLPHLDR
jgi:hypothetical protein